MLIESIQLRSQRVDNLSDKDTKAVLQQHGFYCVDCKWSKEWSNPNGQGIKHSFELQHEHQVVVDHATDLSWQQSGSSKYMAYADVEGYLFQLNKNRFASYDDWRLPTLDEAMSLMEREKKNRNLYIDPVFDRTQQHIWRADKGRAGWAWLVSFNHGGCNRHDIHDKNYVRAVRSRQSSI